MQYKPGIKELTYSERDCWYFLCTFKHTHWCSSAVKIADKQILYFNCLGHATSTCLQTIRDYLEKQLECSNCKLKDVKWQCVHCSDIPMQYNSYDCGAFIYTYAHYLAANSPFMFNQGDMQNIRRHMVLELLSKALILYHNYIHRCLYIM